MKTRRQWQQVGRAPWMLAVVLLLAGITLSGMRAQAGPDARQHPSVQAHQGEVMNVAFIPERDYVVSAGADGVVRTFTVPDLFPDRELHRFPHGAIAMDVSHDGYRVVASDSRSHLALITLWGEEAKGAPLQATQGDNDVVLDLAFMPGDGRILGRMLNPVQTGPAARVWNGKTLQPDRWFEPKAVEGATGMALDDRGELLSMSLDTGGLVRWKVPQSLPARYKKIDRKLVSVTCTPDGGTVLMADEMGGLYVVTEERKEIVKLWDLGEPVTTMCFDRKGEWLAIGTGRPTRRDVYRRTSLGQPWKRPGGAPGVVRLVSLETFMKGPGAGAFPEAKTVRLEGPVGGTMSLDFSANGQRLVAGGSDGSLHLWRISDDKLKVGR